jgi:hypothetical protein
LDEKSPKAKAGPAVKQPTATAKTKAPAKAPKAKVASTEGMDENIPF